MPNWEIGGNKLRATVMEPERSCAVFLKDTKKISGEHFQG